VPLEVECREEGRLGIEQREAQPDGWQPRARHAREGPHRQLADDLARGEVMQEDLDGQLRHAVAGASILVGDTAATAGAALGLSLASIGPPPTSRS